AADFGDLLLECIRLFREQPEVLGRYQRWFKYILVDEYQDTNVAQYLWLRLLSQAPVSPVIPGRRETANPESITTTGSMDSGFAPSARPGMTEEDPFVEFEEGRAASSVQPSPLVGEGGEPEQSEG